jgi:16S rRNA (guanine1207-N2)-methyltransferase
MHVLTIVMDYYYSEKLESKERKGKIISNVRGFDLELFTLSGIFSWKKVDNASRLLAENMKVYPGDKVLDMGCGYGILGIVASLMGADVTFVDVNERAIKVTKKNLEDMGIKGSVVKSNVYNKVKGMFHSVITNPPVAAGFSVCSKIIIEAKEHLLDGGRLQLVARHNKGGDRLMNLMRETFGDVETIAKRGGFRVYVSIKSRATKS